MKSSEQRVQVGVHLVIDVDGRYGWVIASKTMSVCDRTGTMESVKRRGETTFRAFEASLPEPDSFDVRPGRLGVEE